jgi:hypothetical protein
LATGRRNAEYVALLGLLAAVAIWLWPIGLGGKMPVGGDVTQFFLGPMSFLSQSLRQGRVPLWNDLWGLGFPGVGESQMGVFYPPHWLLYGLLPVETAYTASLVLHSLWGALGAYVASRRFGASTVGAVLGAFAWSACGFFDIHQPHQWGYTTGCWMPWAWASAWSIARGECRPGESLLLALVLTLQILPGHFQLAFITQISVIALACAAATSWRRVLIVVGSALSAFALAAAQVWPTLRLARLASNRRDFEYLSGFAETPLHLVSFVAPGLFGRSPLWRPIVWDPFHTSPEETLGYVGLVPLLLALGAIGRGGKQPATRALLVVGVLTLWLSLGPYMPGFRLLIALPGFSFFRAPARWSLAFSLALAILAAIGFDRMTEWVRPTRALVRFVLFGILWIALVLMLVEGGVATARRGWFDRVFVALPWHEADAFAAASRAARRPNMDFRVAETWARQGVRLDSSKPPVFVDRRFEIYQQELAPSLVLLGALLALSPFAERGWFRFALLALTVGDLAVVGRQRRGDLGPIARLVDQSPVLAELSQKGGNPRTVDSLRNLPMIAGAGNVSAYRTLDLPSVDSLTNLASRIPGELPAEIIGDAARASGASIRILDPTERREWLARGLKWPENSHDVHDPALAGWRFGKDWVAQQGDWASTFRIVTREEAPRGWLVAEYGASSETILREWSGNPLEVLNALKPARPLDVHRNGPEHRRIHLQTDGPALAVLSELADPEWQATLDGPGGTRAVTIERAFGRPNQGAWQAVRIPGRGEWVLRLQYRGRDVWQGMAVSGVAVVAWLGLAIRFGRVRLRMAKGEGR